MIGFTPFRSLHSVMLVTLHVAVISYAFRPFIRPTGLAGSFAIWVPLAIVMALFLSLPIGRAVAAAFVPAEGMADRRCRMCGRDDLRPLHRLGPGLFPPIVGYRCDGCMTTYRPAGESFIEEPASGRSASIDPEGIRFELEAPAGEPGIRFLDEEAGGLANIPARPVSDA